MPKFQKALTVFLLGFAACSLRAQDSTPAPRLPEGPTLVFNAETNEYDAKPGEVTALFFIHATNVWTNTIVIYEARPSCHCTVATMPANPWILAPGASGEMVAKVDLTGEFDVIYKTITFFTSVGERVVTLKISIPPPLHAADAPLAPAERQAAMLKAAADPRAIFKESCAACHVEKARGLLGRDLYVAACGICHDSPHRAAVVPDLRGLKQATNSDYWKTIITVGKPHTMMPGFAAAVGGPLTDMQITSLTAYVNQTFSHNPAPR